MRNLLFLSAVFFLLTSMTDPLDDFSQIYESSSNLITDTINPGNFNNDSSRMIRTNNQAGYLIYQVENLNDFSIELCTVDRQRGEIKV